MSLQKYFSGLASSPHESKDKIRDFLSSILESAVTYGLPIRNPMESVKLRPEKRGKKRIKPYSTPEQFQQLVDLIVEPYATMVYTAVYTGLRVSELCALRRGNLHDDSISVRSNTTGATGQLRSQKHRMRPCQPTRKS